MLGRVLRLLGGSPKDSPIAVAPVPGAEVLPSLRPSTALQTVIEPVPIPQTGPRHAGQPVPYYPQRGPAVPAASPERIVATQAELIRELRQASSLSFDEFDRYVKPAINNYAAFVHLLPASEFDHHCDLGGLFRHGLEAALYASRRAEGKEFALNEDPCVRKFQIFRWRACALFGALLHDLGKAVIDVGAVDETGTKVWNPHIQALYDWTQEHQIPYYTISWRGTRKHNEHKAISAAVLLRIFPEETMRWMGEYRGRAAYDAMLMALGGPDDKNNPFFDIILSADMDSTSTDKIAQQRRLASIGEAGSRGYATIAMRAMHDLLLAGTWKVNQVGSPIWLTHEGLYGLEEKTSTGVIEHLRAAGMTWLDDSPIKLRNLLADVGAIVPQPGTDEATLMHRVQIYIPDRAGGFNPVTVSAIKFANQNIIPEHYVLPSAVDVVLMNSNDGTLAPPSTVPPALPASSPPPAAAGAEPPPAPAVGLPSAPPTATPIDESVVDDDDPETNPPPAVSKKSAKTGGGSRKPVKLTPSSDGPPITLKPAASGPLAVHDASDNPFADHNDGVVVPDDDGFSSVPSATPAAGDLQPLPANGVAITSLRDRANERDTRDQLIDEHRAIDRDPFPPTSIEGAKAWLAKQEEGVYLDYVIDRVRNKELTWTKDVLVIDDLLHLSFPGVFDGCGTDAPILRDAFHRRGWLESDPLRPKNLTTVLPVNGIQQAFLRFNYDVSYTLRFLLPGGRQSASTVVDRGPYITGRRAALYSDQNRFTEADGAIVRLAVSEFLTDQFKAAQASWKQASETVILGLLNTFCGQHKLGLTHVRLMLQAGKNPLLEHHDTSVSHRPNAAYDPDIDHRIFVNTPDRAPRP